MKRSLDVYIGTMHIYFPERSSYFESGAFEKNEYAITEHRDNTESGLAKHRDTNYYTIW